MAKVRCIIVRNRSRLRVGGIYEVGDQLDCVHGGDSPWVYVRNDGGIWVGYSKRWFERYDCVMDDGAEEYEEIMRGEEVMDGSIT